MKICPVRAELFHADSRTDRQTGLTKLRVAFCNAVNMPENEQKGNSKEISEISK
jgi:hypothetical protein